jgi:hypothetical protein
MDNKTDFMIDESDLSKIASKFEGMLKTATPSRPVDLEKCNSGILCMDGLAIFGDSYVAYLELIEQLLQIQWVEELFSRDFLKQQVLEIIRKEYPNFEHGTLNAVVAIRSLLSNTRSFVDRWRVLVPVTGIDLNGVEEFRIGNVVFTRFTGANPCLQSLRKTSSTNEILAAEYIFPLEKKIVAIVDEKGEAQRAQEKGISAVQEALDILRFYSSFSVEGQEAKMNLGLKPKLEIWSSVLIQTEKEQVHPFKIPQYIAPFYFTIDSRTLRMMNDNSIDSLDRILKLESPNRTEMQKQILNAINWFGLARQIDDEAMSFVAYCTALDMLVSEKWSTSRGERISQSVAFLIGHSVEERKRIKACQKKLWALRGDVVHAGEWSAGHKRRVYDIQETVKKVIIALLQRPNEFQTKRDLHQWVEIQCLSTPSDQKSST